MYGEVRFSNTDRWNGPPVQCALDDESRLKMMTEIDRRDYYDTY